MVTAASKHSAGATEACDHFVGDQQRPVLVCDVMHIAEESRRRHDVAGCSLNWFDDDSSGTSRNIFLDYLPKLFDRVLPTLCLRACESCWIGVRSEMVTVGSGPTKFFQATSESGRTPAVFP